MGTLGNIPIGINDGLVNWIVSSFPELLQNANVVSGGIWALEVCSYRRWVGGEGGGEGEAVITSSLHIIYDII